MDLRSVKPWQEKQLHGQEAPDGRLAGEITPLRPT